LAEQNILYPSISPNHPFLVAAFHHDKNNFIPAKHMGLKDEVLKKWYESKLSIFQQEVLSYKSTILSSEFFLDLHIDKIKELKLYLEHIFDQISVIVYVRHPIDHLSSAINEQIKQGHYNLDTAYHLHSDGREYKKILDWVNIFGEKHIILRPFEREQFINNDILNDFLTTASAAHLIDKIKKPKTNENITLTYPAIEIANQLLKFAPSFSSKRNSTKYLHEINGIKYTAPKEIKDEIMRNTEPYLKKFKKLGLTFHKKYEYGNDPVCTEIWSENTIESIAVILNDYTGKISFLESENARLNALLQKGRNLDLAEDYFRNAIATGRNFAAFRDYAVFLMEGQRYNEALQYCNKAIKLENNRPWLYELKNKIAEAIDVKKKGEE
jgi:tetratricopeptide (TPR) repeat protein